MNSRRRIRHASEPLYGQQATAAWGAWERVASGRGATSLDLFCSAGGCLWPAAEVSEAASHFRFLGRTGRFRSRLNSSRMSSGPKDFHLGALPEPYVNALALGATCLAGGCPALRAESPLVTFWVARFQVAHEARFRPYDGPAAWSARCDGLHGRC